MKKLSYLLIVCAFLISCESLDLKRWHDGAIVLGKFKDNLPSYNLTLKLKNGDFQTRQVYKSYYDYYQVGDTIK